MSGNKIFKLKTRLFKVLDQDWAGQNFGSVKQNFLLNMCSLNKCPNGQWGILLFPKQNFCIANMALGKVVTAETSKVDFQQSRSYKMFYFDRAVLECFRGETNLVVAGFWREWCLDLSLCILPARTLTVLKPPDWGHHNVAHLVGRSSPSKVWSLALFYSVKFLKYVNKQCLRWLCLTLTVWCHGILKLSLESL